MIALGRRGRTPLALVDGAVHVWPVRRSDGGDPVARVLARYIRPADGELTIVRGAGKPHLDESGADVRFNVAHAGSILLVAVARGREIGVDVEPLGRGPWLSLPGHVLTPAELRSLDGLAGRARDASFLRLWARKEAVLKAAGVGLAVDPGLVAVSGPAEPPAVLGVPASMGPAARWGLVDLPLPGYAAAVAVERPHAPVVVLPRTPPSLRVLTKSLRLRDVRLTRAL